jgi:thioredoxin-related protein
MVKSTDEELIKKLKIKSFPAFLLFKGGEAKPIKYDGDTYTY